MLSLSCIGCSRAGYNAAVADQNKAYYQVQHIANIVTAQKKKKIEMTQAKFCYAGGGFVFELSGITSEACYVR